MKPTPREKEQAAAVVKALALPDPREATKVRFLLEILSELGVTGPEALQWCVDHQAESPILSRMGKAEMVERVSRAIELMCLPGFTKGFKP